MNLIAQVYDSLKWKKSDDFCADRLGLSIEKYKNVKEQILSAKQFIQSDFDQVIKDLIQKRIIEQKEEEELSEEVVKQFEAQLQSAALQQKSKLIETKENLDEGTAELKGISFTEPKSPEEIEKILKIDTTRWRLSTYWNKEHKGYWLVSAMVTRIKPEPIDYLKEILSTTKLKYIPSAPVHINKIYTDKTCAVLSLQDIHIGKENIDNIYDISTSVKKCVENLVMRSYHSCNLDKIIFVLGGDLLNVDTYIGTTTSGTLVDSSISALQMYQEAFELMFWTINYLKQFCNELEVVYIPGNHDRLSSAQLAYSLSKVFQDPSIIWNIEYAERKVIVYGNSFIAVEHGDVTLNKSFVAFASEFSKQWGETKFRTLYSGHYHKEKKVEYITADELNGFTMKILPSLTRTDKYHYTNKWTNAKRGGIIELHSATKGPTGTFSYYE